MANLEQDPSRSIEDTEYAPAQVPSDNPYQSYSWMQLHDTLLEKEYLLECAQDSIKRLSVFETENTRKDELIVSLRKDLAAFKKNSRKKDFSYVSMEEHLASCEGHLQERIDEVKTLQQELEDARKELDAYSARSVTIQKELLTKKSLNNRHLKDIVKLQQQHRSDSENILCLKKELTEKQSATMSLQERVKRLRCANQELQKRLEEAQNQREAMSLCEQSLKAELAKLKNHTSNGKLLEARQDFFEQELTKAKRKENHMACEVGRLRDELTSMCKNIASLTNTTTSTETSMALCAVSNLVEEHSQTLESVNNLTQQLEKLQNDHRVVCKRVEELQQLWTGFKNAVNEDSLSALDTLISGLHESESSEIFKDLKDTMLESLSNLSAFINQQSSSLSKLSEMVVTSYGSLANHEKEVEDPTIMMSFVREKIQSMLSECEHLNQRLCESEIEHGAALSGAVAALRQDEQIRVTKLIERTREEEMEKWSTKLQELRQKLEIENKEAVQQEQAYTKTLSQELKQLKQTVDSEQTQHEVLKAKLINVEAELAALEESKNEALQEAAAQQYVTVEKLTREIIAYKTKAHQYALTIASLEEKLLDMMSQAKTLQASDEKRLSSNTPSCDKELNEMKIAKMQELIEVLRHQLSLASDNGASQDTQIKQLLDSVKEGHVKIQEKEDELTQHYSEVLCDLRVSMAKQEEIIKNQRIEIEKLECTVAEMTFQSSTQEKHFQRAAEELTAVNFRLKHKDTVFQDCDVVLQVGQKCLGEKHEETILSQQQAISHLRQRLSDVESANPPVGSHQVTLKELSRVRRELLKLKSERATSTIACGKDRDMSSDNKHSLKKDIELIRNHKAQEKLIQEALNCSERSYKELAETVYKALPDMKWPDIGVISAQTEHATRKKMLTERKKFTNSVITSLRDLTTKKLEGEGNPGMDEEALKNIAQLEAQLRSVSEELEQQKRLNKALLKRKDFKEAQQAETCRRHQHSCVTTT